MNTPYVKEFDSLGVVKNPIEKIYASPFKNRQQRRQIFQKDRFYGESKNHHLTVTRMGKCVRRKQNIECRERKGGRLTGEIRVIEHYTECN